MDKDGDVNSVDFSIFASQWLKCGNPFDPDCDVLPPCPCSELNFDLDGNALVTITDLSMLTMCVMDSSCPPWADYNCDWFVDEEDAYILYAILECIGSHYMGTLEQAEACCEMVQ